MQASHPFPALYSPAVSPAGTLIASFSKNHLEVRKAQSLHLIKRFVVPIKYAKNRSISWSPKCDTDPETARIAVCSDTGAAVFSLYSGQIAKIDGGNSLGRVVYGCFGSSDDEYLTFSDLGFKVTVWSLSAGTSVDIRDPKFGDARSVANRPRSGHLTLLSRPGPQDIITLHGYESANVIWTAQLPTIDAQGMKWSPDGRFLAVWDSANVGCKIYIYTAAGNLYRTYSGEDGDATELGVKTLEWSPSADFLAVGTYDDRIKLLNAKTFSPITTLEHAAVTQPGPSLTVWQEKWVVMTCTGDLESITTPVHHPTDSTQPPMSHLMYGTSTITFSSDGAYFCTRSTKYPNSAWIWSSSKAVPIAVIVYHRPILHTEWHKTVPNLLLTRCDSTMPNVYLWEGPEIVPSCWKLPVPELPGGKRPNGRAHHSHWLDHSATTNPVILYGDGRTALIGWPRGRDLGTLAEEEEPASLPRRVSDGSDEDGDESLDSVFQALTGRPGSPFKQGGHTEILVSDVLDDETVLDDTFHGRGITGNR